MIRRTWRRYVEFSVYKYLAYFQLHNMNTRKDECTSWHKVLILQIFYLHSSESEYDKLMTVNYLKYFNIPPSWPQEFHARNNVAVRRMTWSHYTCMCTVIGIRGISPCKVLYSHWAGIYMHCVTWIEGNGSEQSHLIRNEEEGRGESLHVAADPRLWCQHSLQISRHPSELCHQNGYKKLSCT